MNNTPIYEGKKTFVCAHSYNAIYIYITWDVTMGSNKCYCHVPMVVTMFVPIVTMVVDLAIAQHLIGN
jgi:hypothetical protein